MLAIFKKELKSYFYSPVAYVLIGLFILVASVFFFLGNIGVQSADFTQILSPITFILIIIVPVMTMRAIAEDRKNGTEVLLRSSPASITDMVLGKYLAVLALFIIMTVLMLIYLLVIFMYGGRPSMGPIIGGLIGFVLLGASYISIGVFASALTENQIISAIVSFVMLLLISFIEGIGNAIGGVATTILNWFALTARYYDFTKGMFNVANVVYYISFIAVFLFMTIRLIEKRRWSQG